MAALTAILTGSAARRSSQPDYNGEAVVLFSALGLALTLAFLSQLGADVF